MAGERYDIKTKIRVYPNLPLVIILKYIENGRFQANDSISDCGSNNWQEMISHPITASSFGAKLEDEVLFEIQLPGQSPRAVSGDEISRMISQEEFKEAHRARLQGEESWRLAGDIDELHEYFSFRWTQQSQTGGAAKAAVQEVGTPFFLDIVGLFRFFNHSSFFYNFIAILVAAVFFSIVPLIGIFGILVTIWVYSYGFRLLGKVSEGATRFPEWGNSSDIIGRLIRPAFSYLLANLVGLLPLIVYLGSTDMLLMLMLNPFLSLIMLWADPVIWLCLAFYIFYFPMAITRMAAYDETLPPVNVFALIISVKRAFFNYLMLILVLMGMDLLVTGVAILISIFFAIGMFTPMGSLSQFAGQFAVRGLNLTLFFVKMFIMGRFLFQNRSKMGWD